MLMGIILIAVIILVVLAVYQNNQPVVNMTTATHAIPKKRESLDALPDTFVVFDVETSGLSPFDNEIIEIAAIKAHKNASEHQTFTALVKPSKPISKKIIDMTGITNEMLEKDGIPIADALEGFRQFIGKEKLVAYNKDFDKSFINMAAERLRIDPIVKHVSCAYKKARAAWPGLKSYKLCDLAKMRGLDMDGNHRALGDCKRTMMLYVAAAQIVKNKYHGSKSAGR
jgi:DNA polymerase III subunit epsilon